MNRLIPLLICLTLIGAMPLAAAGDKEAFTADSAYKAMLTLEGTWKGESNVVPVGKTKAEGTVSDTSVTYEVIANGTSLMATYLKGNPMEMVSMFHQDHSSELIHTHYCAVGNQPTMRFEAVKEKGVVNFEFLRGSNMDVNKDGHVHASKIKFVDKDTIETATKNWRDGKHASTRYTKMKRQK
jgi:hypothetical protein